MGYGHRPPRFASARDGAINFGCARDARSFLPVNALSKLVSPVFLEVLMRRCSWLAIILLLLPFTAAHAQNQRAAREHLKRGLVRFSRGDLDGAVDEYTQAIELDSSLAEAHISRGKARRARGDLDGAIQDFERAIEIDPRSGYNNRDITQAYTNRGFIRANQLDIEGALSDLDRAIQFSPSDADAYAKRGRALLINSNFASAVADLDRSISLDPRNPLNYVDRGIARFHQGHETEAVRDFNKSLQLNGDLRLFLQLHIMELEMLIKEAQQKRQATQPRIAKTSPLVQHQTSGRT